MAEMADANRHPADQLADIRSKIRRLQDREEELRDWLLEHPEAHQGEEFQVEVGTQQRRKVNLRGLADAIGASVLERFTRCTTVTVVKLRERERVE
jgi:hypothetical protein